MQNISDYWVFGLCPSFCILKDTTFWKMVPLLSSVEWVGDTYSVGPTRKS
jgi:hypothetical protein